MSTEDVVVSVMAILLSVLALGVGYYVLLEAVGILREWAQTLRESRSQPSLRVPRSPDDTGPLPAIRPYHEEKPAGRRVDASETGPDGTGE